ncbi:MAG: hypothetical protein VKM92_04940 [Cyanobacteriota bacterium]|nr:hypothetical protein [Cyanobacteriota bacterium]
MSILVALLKQRHRYYRSLLVVEVLALLGLSSLQRAPQLMGLLYLLITGVVVVFDSPLLASHRLQTKGLLERLNGRHRNHIERVLWRRRVIVWGWLVCLAMEVVWQSALVLNPTLAVTLSTPHLVVWLALILQMLWSLVNALAEEPQFTGAVLMGAAAGYLLVGFAGGILLTSLFVLEPTAFNVPQQAGGLAAGIVHAPRLLGAAFGCLTTLGSPALKLDHLTALSAANAITMMGQLYLAIMIAGVLGKPRPRVSGLQARAHRSAMDPMANPAGRRRC